MIRVLHVVENFNGQAVESWLTRVVCNDEFNWEKLHFDFFLLGKGPGKKADLVTNKGCRLYQGNPDGGASLPMMARGLRRVARSGGYDVVHIHQDVMAGVFAVALLGTNVRIVTHAHNCRQRLPVGGYYKEKILTALAKNAARHFSNVMIGVSTVALAELTGHRAKPGRKDLVIYCGVDPGRFLRARCNARLFREELGWDEDAWILLFAGRLVPEKNPGLVLEILCELRKEHPRAVAVFVGEGPLGESLRDRAKTYALSEKVRFLGWRDDIHEIMCCSDCFIHSGPEQPMEGFGLVALEAQLAGLPLLLSKGIPDDAVLPGSVVRRLSVKEPAGRWAREAQEIVSLARPGREEASATLAMTRMDQRAAIRELLELYAE